MRVLMIVLVRMAMLMIVFMLLVVRMICWMYMAVVMLVRVIRSVRMVVLMTVRSMGLFCQRFPLHHLHSRTRNPAPIHRLDLQSRAQLQRRGGLLQYLHRNPCIDQRTEKHIAGNPSKAF